MSAGRGDEGRKWAGPSQGEGGEGKQREAGVKPTLTLVAIFIF